MHLERQVFRSKVRFQRQLVRVGGVLIVLCFAVVFCGVAYNALSLRHFRSMAGIPGKLYDVSGYPMHLYCTGQGSPTVVMDAGLGDDFTTWAKVQPVLSQTTRICSYDRAGFGWSQARPGIQDANAISSQLHQLLEHAEVQRPFVLAGHSISGIYMRAYAEHYPDDLSGLIFVDGATPLQMDRIPKQLLRIEEDQRRQMPWQKFLMTVGWYRLQGICTSVPADEEAYSLWIKADSCVPSQTDAIENEIDAERASGKETIHAGPFGNFPVLIFSRDPNVLTPNWPVAVSKANSVVWDQMQEEAKQLSTQSIRIIAKRSSHYIQNDRPDLVNHEITAFISMIRSRQSYSDNHLTKEE